MDLSDFLPLVTGAGGLWIGLKLRFGKKKDEKSIDIGLNAGIGGGGEGSKPTFEEGYKPTEEDGQNDLPFGIPGLGTSGKKPKSKSKLSRFLNRGGAE